MRCFRNVIVTVVTRATREKIVYETIAPIKILYYFSQITRRKMIGITTITVVIMPTVEQIRAVGDGESQKITCQR